ncbi:MAG: cell wall metabolism sensor histidine kinase WalK [Clostridia bacterium]|nr:cell wall metabolism sensor histidine kinase WalK [Clostridia bacterium]
MKNASSIQWKLIAVYNIIVLIAMIVSGIFILWQLEEYEYGKIEDELTATTSNFMSVTLEDDSEETIINTFKNYLEENSSFYTDKDTELYVLDSLGNYLFSSVPNLEVSDNEFFKSAIISAINGVKKFEKIKDKENNELMTYACPLSISGEVKAIIYTRVKTTSVVATIEKTRTIIVLSTVIAMMLSVVTGFIFAKTLTDPIKDLTNTASKMARGEIYQSVDVKGNDEIGQLARTFNFMSVELNKTLSDITNEKNKLQTVFEHMQDGIIAFNIKGEIIHANTALYDILENHKRIFNISDLTNTLGIEIDIDEFIRSNTNMIKNHELNYKKKIINVVVVNYLNDKKVTEGIIVMIQDATEQRKLDNMRKEFVANVSHELRTPLTTVKGYVETLMDGNVDDEETKERFLRVINNETDRMTFLVHDLLELSRFDNSQIKLEKTDVDIYELVSDACLAQKITANNKKQNLVVDLPKEKELIRVDSRRIIQVITNLLSNAIKYSEEGATIKVYSNKTDEQIEIIVQDNGMGIPKEDLGRIFERFYRVDKARSRAMGGTGLGLPIAKEIMQLHGGDIIIDSEYKKGTTARIIFPILN